MESGLLLLVLLPVFTSTGESATLPDQYTRGLDWLSRYGYLPPPDPRTSKLQTMEGLERAIRVMQRFGGLKETGQLDSDTLQLMSVPRCSLPDIVGREDMLRKRRKRYALSGLKWDKTDLTWSIHSYPSPSVSPYLPTDVVESLLVRAFQAWSAAAPLSFHQTPGGAGGGPGAGGDIRVSFVRSLHDDGYPFDGKGGTLAHAFFPGRDQVAGDTHFDDDEVWSYGGHDGSTDLFTVAVHEFGHALGLSHSSSSPSIMRPYYQGAVGDVTSYSLPMDDTLAIQQLYGRREDRVTARPEGGTTPHLPRLPQTPHPRPTLHPDPALQERCGGGFDAVANIRGEVFFFKGPHFWRLQRTGSLVSLRPALISNFWLGLPPGTANIDAVYERKRDSRIIFFIGDQYWVFQDTESLPGFPRPLADWGMRGRDGRGPRRVEAAFVWAHNGNTYLFSMGEYWRFDETQTQGDALGKPQPGYPKPTTLWRGVPSHPDDIITWEGGNAYFFKDNLYWVLERGQMDQDNVISKSTAELLMCPAPAPTQQPSNPTHRSCQCEIGASANFRGSWLMVLSLTFVLSRL
ncbi:matrix metalloproteinase-25 isoform X2 [Osmerus mordax]|uniref:matrix metalloproteinase-25 isoform X2 n=1 Tax=Osmerus mordax TaxID=8014 RepID=UPI00350F717A